MNMTYGVILMIVKVNCNVFESEYKKNSDYISQYEDQILKIKGTIDDISTIWKDSDFTYFQTQMQTYLNDLIAIKEQLKSYNEYMYGYSKAVDSLDSAYGNKKINIE